MIVDFLKRLIGDKNLKDQKEYQPFVEATNEVYPEIQGLSDDGLRDETKGFITRIENEKAPLETKLKELKDSADDFNSSVQDKIEIFEKIENLEKDYNRMIRRKYLYTTNFALSNSDSEAAAYIALTELYDANIKLLDTINKKLSKEVKNSIYGKRLDTYISKIKSKENK